MKLLSIRYVDERTVPQRTLCNRCGLPKYQWQYHWRIVGVERLKVCKTCRNKVNRKMNDNKNLTMSDTQTLIDTYTDDEIKFSFGQFKGETNEDVPNYYLDWFLDADFKHDHYDFMTVPIEKELAYRKEFNIYISGEE